MTTWRKCLTEELKIHEESFRDIIKCTLSENELDVEFDDGYGGVEGKPFTAWTATRVYFPDCYDGSESAVSVARNPCDEATEHIDGD